MSGIVAVSGNPRAGSRTHQVGLTLAEALSDALSGALSDDCPVAELEVISVADHLFAAPDQRSPDLKEALVTLQGAALAIIATPVYKAGYTGLLKSFLDLYAAGDLTGVVAVPVVVSGSPAHSFVGEIHLRPVLTELGATVATPAFTVTEGQLGGLDDLVQEWIGRHQPIVDRLLRR